VAEPPIGDGGIVPLAPDPAPDPDPPAAAAEAVAVPNPLLASRVLFLSTVSMQAVMVSRATMTSQGCEAQNSPWARNKRPIMAAARPNPVQIWPILAGCGMQKKNKLSVNTLLTGFSQLPRERSAFYVVYLILFFF